jgi:hypothetical protein
MGISQVSVSVQLPAVQQRHQALVVVVIVDWLVHTVLPSPMHPTVLSQLPSFITPVPWRQYVCLTTNSTGRNAVPVTNPD